MAADPQSKAEGWSVPPDAASVAVTQTPEELDVTFIGEEEERVSQRFRRFKLGRSEKRYDVLYTCRVVKDEPRLSFPFTGVSDESSDRWYYADPWVEDRDTSIFLWKAVDGALVVQSRAVTIVGSPLIIGTRLSFDSVWWRYPALAAGTISDE